MTFSPNTLMMDGRSAVDLVNDAGEVVATLYGRKEGLEIVCLQGNRADLAIDTSSLVQHVTVTIRQDWRD